MYVECDKCKCTFEIDLKKDEIKLDGKKIKRTYYTCPGCKKKYLVFLQDVEIDRLLEKFETASKIRVAVPYRQKSIDVIKQKIKKKEERMVKLYGRRNKGC